MRVTLTRKNRVLASGEVLDSHRGSLYIRLDDHPGQTFRFDRRSRRDGIYYVGGARTVRELGKVEILPEEDHVRERAEGKERSPATGTSQGARGAGGRRT